jgi:hypothetical protein
MSNHMGSLRLHSIGVSSAIVGIPAKEYLDESQAASNNCYVIKLCGDLLGQNKIEHGVNILTMIHSSGFGLLQCLSWYRYRGNL